MQNSLKKSILLLLTSPLCLFSLGGKPEVVTGTADYEVSGAGEVVRVSDKTILEYKKFNIDKDETTRYEQPSSKSTLLCRVKGGDASIIRGKLEANGKLLFINPNGIIFSATAHVNVGTLMASTLDINNDDFLKGLYKFNLSPDAHDSAIVNKGLIESAHNVVFMAPKVVNQGVISVKTGKIAFGGGEAMTLDFDGDELIQFAVDAPIAKGFIEQAGELHAAQVYMKLPMAQQVIKSVLNVSGIVEAGRIEIENGVIRLAAGSKTQTKHLDVEGHILEAASPVSVNTFTSRISSHYLLKEAIKLNNNALVFTAPVFLSAPDLSFSTGDLGGPITFMDRLEAKTPVCKLTLSSGTGDIDFKKEVLMDRLEILSAHNVNTGSVNVGDLIVSNVKGIVMIGGEVNAAREAALQGYALNLANSITVAKGPLTLETDGQLKSSETATLSAASIVQKGTGDVSLGGKWIAQSGNVSLDGNVHLLGAVLVEAPNGDVIFTQGIDGLGGLTSHSQNFSVKGNVGRIAHLTVEAEQSIRIGNVGVRHEGIEGMLHLRAKGPIFFEGTNYVASGYDLWSASSFEFTSGQLTKVFTKSMHPTTFQGSPLKISENTNLEIRSSQGPVTIESIEGKSGSNLTINTSNNELKIGGIEGIDRLRLQANVLNFQTSFDAGSIDLVASQPILINHPITALNGDFIVDAPLILNAPETLLQALQGKLMQFNGPLSGNTKLTLNAPEGEIVLKDQLNGPKKFQQINIHGKKISQYQSVTSTGPVHYTAGQIFLGHDITTDNAITLDGPVTLFHQDAIHLTANKFNKGPILLTSTLDADLPTRMLTLQNEKSPTQIKGAIGKNGPLGELVINSKNVVFHDDIGGDRPGIAGRLRVKSTTVECKGSMYYAGEQLWNTGKIQFTYAGPVEIKTAGLPLRFGPDAKIELDHTTAFTIKTQGGLLDLAPVISDYAQPITILAGSGEVHLKEIGKKVTNLHVEGRDILLSGHLEADQFFMEAEHHIEYDQTKGAEIISTALQSEGIIILNSKRSMLGNADKPLNIQTTGDLFVGAKSVAYLEGKCADQNPHVYIPNPAPRIFFNGYEYNYLFIDDNADEDALLKTIAPALSQKTPTNFMDGAEIKPRKAPIYYDTSAK